jgi:hypothetical protein
MPPLIAKWQQLPDSDKDLFPLLECFTSIAQVFPGLVFSLSIVFLSTGCLPSISLLRNQSVVAGSL